MSVTTSDKITRHDTGWRYDEWHYAQKKSNAASVGRG